MLRKTVAVVLLAAGVLALVYKGFTYTKETHGAELGPLKFQIKERDRIDVPAWVGVILVAAGGGLLLVPSRGRRD